MRINPFCRNPRFQIIRRLENENFRISVHLRQECASPRQLTLPLLRTDEVCMDRTFERVLGLEQAGEAIRLGQVGADRHQIDLACGGPLATDPYANEASKGLPSEKATS
jgi:hypothetical protein